LHRVAFQLFLGLLLTCRGTTGRRNWSFKSLDAPRRIGEAFMLDSLKNTLWTSLVVSHEKLEACLGRLVDRGALTREQVHKIFQELATRTEAEGRRLSEAVSGEVSRLARRGPFVTRGEFEGLQERVRRLEVRLGAEAPDELDAPPCADPLSGSGEEEK
jgi:polyhydroxyalkanoate synthesis regulator phasin